MNFQPKYAPLTLVKKPKPVTTNTKIDLTEPEFQSQSQSASEGGSNSDSNPSSGFDSEDMMGGNRSPPTRDRKRLRKLKDTKNNSTSTTTKPKFQMVSMTIGDIQKTLSDRIIGQPYAIECISPVLTFISRRSRIPKESTQRVYTILFAGPTGTGKTELTSSIRSLFNCDVGQELDYLVVKETMGTVHDASHFNKYTSVGAGYAGYGDKSLISKLNDAISTFKTKYRTPPPFLLLILDEIDKAASSVFNIFNSLFDKGELSGGSDSFTLPQETFLLILCTSNFGSHNDRAFPSKSIEHTKEEMITKGKLDPCDVGRMRLVVPFFELTDKDRKTIASKVLQRIMTEYGHQKKLSDDFISSYTNYILRRSQKDMRSMEKEMIDVFDALFTAHESRYYDTKNNFLLYFKDAFLVDYRIGDFKNGNSTRHDEYVNCIEEAEKIGKSIDSMIPCIVLQVGNVVHQTYVLPFNQFSIFKEAATEEDLIAAAKEELKNEIVQFESKRQAFIEDNEKAMNAFKSRVAMIQSDLDIISHKVNMDIV